MDVVLCGIGGGVSPFFDGVGDNGCSPGEGKLKAVVAAVVVVVDNDCSLFLCASICALACIKLAERVGRGGGEASSSGDLGPVAPLAPLPSISISAVSLDLSGFGIYKTDTTLYSYIV